VHVLQPGRPSVDKVRVQWDWLQFGNRFLTEQNVVLAGCNINLLKPSGNFTYHQV
jgi:hypothetical protein